MSSHYHWFLVCALSAAFYTTDTPLFAQENHQENQKPATEITDSLPPTSSNTLAEPEVTLDELVSLALQNNPQIKAAQATESAAQARLRAIRSLANPMVQLVPGVGDRTARDEEVILAQPIDLFGQRRAQRRLAVTENRRAQIQVWGIRQRIAFEVKNTALQLFAAQENQRLTAAQLEIAQAFRTAAERRAALGESAPIQVQRADLELLRLRNEFVRAKANTLAQRAALNGLLARDPQTPFRVTLPLGRELMPSLQTLTVPTGTTTGTASEPPGAPPTVAAGATLDANQIGAAPLERRADIAGARATLETQRAQLGVTRSRNRPSFELQARRSSFFGRDGNYGLRAVITAPLFDFGSNRGERRAIEADIRAQESTVRNLETQARSQIEVARLRAEAERATVTRFRTEVVPLALDLLRKTQLGFETGASTTLELLEAQRALRGVQADYLQALSALGTQEIALENALGLTTGEAGP